MTAGAVSAMINGDHMHGVGRHRATEGACRYDRHRRERSDRRDSAVGLDTGPGGVPPRHTGVRRRGAICRDGGVGLRQPRLPERSAGVPRGDPGGVAHRFASWLPVGGRGGQLVHVVLGADGFGVAVPDWQLRHRVLLGVPRPVRWADGDRRAGARAAVGDPRHDRRHVVPVGDRHRPSRPGPQRRGPVPARRSGL